MKATFVELRTKSSEIIRALERNESVTVFYRGKPVAVMQPIVADRSVEPQTKAANHAAFGIWRDREEMTDPVAHVRNLRRGRFHDH